MSYVPTDHLMWDFWFAPHQPGEPLHVFYLRAPASIADPEDRHWQAEVGHAVSHDLQSWEDLGVALSPSAGPAWDDKAIWTGSIIGHNGTWYWFYTALTHADTQQRIGLATSRDLTSWERYHGNPVLQADERWCEAADTSPDGHVAFRDPWVVRSPDGDGWLMYITTRVNHGPDDGRGVIALAKSRDLLDWDLDGPVTSSGAFAEMEVPQYLETSGRKYLLFCTGKPSHQRLSTPGVSRWTGTHYLTAASAEGPWHLAPEPPMAADAEGSWYAGRVVNVNAGWWFFAWRRARDGQFAGGLSDPAPLEIGDDGRLRVPLERLDNSGMPWHSI